MPDERKLRKIGTATFKDTTKIHTAKSTRPYHILLPYRLIQMPLFAHHFDDFFIQPAGGRHCAFAADACLEHRRVTGSQATDTERDKGNNKQRRDKEQDTFYEILDHDGVA